MGAVLGEEHVEEASVRNAEIRRRYKKGDAVRDIADDYGVSTQRIRQIINPTKAAGNPRLHGGFDPELVRKIGERLRRSREMAGLTQDDVARQIGVSTKTVQRWENEGYEPGIVGVMRWADLTGVKLSWITGTGDTDIPELSGDQLRVLLRQAETLTNAIRSLPDA
jgi:transcriptional regulator with XRE-family HTH domain